jgi:nitroreductase
MDAYLAIASRRDERRYRPDPLPDDVVERILDAGRLSGSASNRQPWTFVIPSSPSRLERIAGTVFEPGNIHGAGLVVAIVVKGKGPVRFDAELAEDEEVAIVLSFGLPEKPRAVAARSAEEWSARANRKPLAELVRRLD